MNTYLYLLPMQLIVKAVHLRPDPALSAQECCLKVSLLPLWFNLDQDTLAFLVGYLSKLGTDESTGMFGVGGAFCHVLFKKFYILCSLILINES